MPEYTQKELLRNWLLADSLNFTRYFFHAMNGGKKFIVGRHHRLICDALNGVFQGKIKRLIINIAPRYSKTEISVKQFIAMGLAINPASQFIHLSYSGDLATDNSVDIKDIVKSQAFQDVFDAKVRDGSDTKEQWDTEQGGGVFAKSTLGQITGFGAGAVEEEGKPYIFAGAIVIDDPIKPEDALSDTIRERVNRRFETTIRNRVNSRNTPIIIIMQRLHENDLCGYLMNLEPDEWTVLSIPCLEVGEDGQEQALWPFKHTVSELHKIEQANSFVFETQYLQNPKPLEGLMYTTFRTYETLPMEKGIRKNYTDTADTGSDYLCSIDYLETKTAMYILDVTYTNKPMEYTEPTTAAMLLRDEVQYVAIESNNGGRGFSRNVERIVREQGSHVAKAMMFRPFSQTANKESRIFSHSAEVQNLIFYPVGWESKWPQFANAIKSHRKEGRNLHDDAPDCLTGMTEMFKGGRQGIDLKRLQRLV